MKQSATDPNLRTKAWKRLRKTLGIKPGAERRYVLQCAVEEIERLRKELEDGKAKVTEGATSV